MGLGAYHGFEIKHEALKLISLRNDSPQGAAEAVVTRRASEMADLERILKSLHDAEIQFGIQSEPPDGGITAWIDGGDRTEKATFFGYKATFFGHIEGDDQVWPAGDIAKWLLETAARLFPEYTPPG